MRILIADDDRMSTMMLERTLVSWGHTVVVTTDGTTAWEILTGHEPPPLAIVDWMMPGLDGIDLCKRIRATPPMAPVYIVLLTSRSARADLIAGLEAGADDYLTKPFDPGELRARIHVGQRTLDLLANIKHLSGLLPICSYCKRIRTGQDYWDEVDRYVTNHSNAQFSHGICPTCLAKVMAEFNSGLM